MVSGYIHHRKAPTHWADFRGLIELLGAGLMRKRRSIDSVSLLLVVIKETIKCERKTFLDAKH